MIVSCDEIKRENLVGEADFNIDIALEVKKEYDPG